jgi:hypothetical protein
MTTTATDTRTTSETLPAVECTSWCQDGDGHTDAYCLQDQVCCGARYSVKLTREALIEDADHGWQLDSLDLYLAKWPKGAPTSTSAVTSCSASS